MSNFQLQSFDFTARLRKLTTNSNVEVEKILSQKEEYWPIQEEMSVEDKLIQMVSLELKKSLDEEIIKKIFNYEQDKQ